MRYLVLCLFLVLVFNSCSTPSGATDPGMVVGNVYLITDSMPPFTHFIPAVGAIVQGYDHSVKTDVNGHYGCYFLDAPYGFDVTMEGYGSPRIYNIPVPPGGIVAYSDIFLLPLPSGSYSISNYNADSYAKDSAVYFTGYYFRDKKSKLIPNKLVISFYQLKDEVEGDMPNRQFAFDEPIDSFPRTLKFPRVDSLIAAGFHHGDTIFTVIQPAYVDSAYGKYKNRYIGDFYYLRTKKPILQSTQFVIP